MSTPQAPRRNPSRETKASGATKSTSSPRDRRPSRSVAASAKQQASSTHARRASQPPSPQSQSPTGRSPRHSAASRSRGSRSTQASSPHARAHEQSRAGSGSRPSSAGHHHHHHHHRGSRSGGGSPAPSQEPPHDSSSTQPARSPGSATRTSRDRSLRGSSAARERTALCRYMERYGAMQPLRIALLQLYEQRPTKGMAMVQMRASLGDNRPNMQEWQLMKRQVNDSVAQIASLKAEGERLRNRLDVLHRGVLPSLNLGRSLYR